MAVVGNELLLSKFQAKGTISELWLLNCLWAGAAPDLFSEERQALHMGPPWPDPVAEVWGVSTKGTSPP